MRKTKLLVLLALVLLIMAALKCCGGKKNADDVDLPDTVQSEQELPETVTENTDMPLGVVRENEDGGVIITLTKEDGTTEEFAFTDVAADSWYIDAVNYAVSAGLISGDADGSVFRPDYGMQRLDFATALYRFAEGESLPDGSNGAQTDRCIAWVTDHGYMRGKQDGDFDPSGYLSCEEALIVIYRLAGEPKPGGTLENYPYAPKVSDYGADAVAWAWNSGLIVEQECVWYPTQTISRAQVALLLMRYSNMAGSVSTQ